MRIGIIAPSSPVGPVELELGLRWLRSCGFEVVVHPRALDRHYLHAGPDEDRAGQLLDFAFDDAIDVVWCARGGNGAARLPPLLRAATRDRRPPRKLLVGYSDITVLHQFARQTWGWSTLHGVVPASNLGAVAPEQLAATADLVRRRRPTLGYEGPHLRFVADAPAEPVEAELIGGNMSLWTCLVGTPDAEPAAGKLLFLEDVNELLYRIDRYATQIAAAGGFNGCRGVILGDFTDTHDESNTMMAPTDDLDAVDWRTHPRVPQRPRWSLEEGLRETFTAALATAGPRVPLASGLPVGHGPNYWPLPLGGWYRLGVDGALTLLQWDWLDR